MYSILEIVLGISRFKHNKKGESLFLPFRVSPINETNSGVIIHHLSPKSVSVRLISRP